MSRRDEALARAQRTRTGRVWVSLLPAIVFLVVLIVFIAENGQHVQVKFFGATGHISLALALLIAAVSGAVLVLLVGSVRILQLRVAAWRHGRGAGRSGGHATSAAVPPADEAQPVAPEGDADTARP
jgi:uncharacterized integral membrane protein